MAVYQNNAIIMVRGEPNTREFRYVRFSFVGADQSNFTMNVYDSRGMADDDCLVKEVFGYCKDPLTVGVTRDCLPQSLYAFHSKGFTTFEIQGGVEFVRDVLGQVDRLGSKG